MTRPTSELIGAAERRYLFRQLIQGRPHLGRVWLATSEEDSFVLKDIPKAIFSSFNEDIRPRLRASPFLRLPYDTIPNQRIFMYKYMNDDFLSLFKKQIPVDPRKQILKASLRRIADLHSHDIVHLGEVQIIDLENAAYLPKGRCTKGMLAGNDNWRSPEGHFKGELSKPSDIFSFATVCIYAMLGQVIFGADEDLRKHESHGAFPHVIRLQRQVSFFGDREGLNGFMTHVGDKEINCQVLGFLWDDRMADYHSYKSFSDWPSITDDNFKDIILKMTNLDP